MKKINVLCVLGLICAVFMSGCGQQSGGGSGDYSRASSDLQNVASGLQSSAGSTSSSTDKSGEGAGGATTSSFNIGGLPAAIQSVPSGWDATKTVSFEGSYTYTTSTGAVVTQESEMYMRYLDANGNQLGTSWSDLITWEVSGDGYNITFLAKKQQMVSNATCPYYTGYMTQLVDLPTTFALPLSMSMTAEGWIRFTGSTVSTFEITSLSLTMTISSAGDGSASGSMDWGYSASSSSYAYYYGTVNMSFSSLGSDPSAMSGDVYQDLTNDGAQNGVKVGTITFDSSGSVKITLDNGTVIYPGFQT